MCDLELFPKSGHNICIILSIMLAKLHGGSLLATHDQFFNSIYINQ